MTNKFRLGDEVIINNPSSKFHKYKGKIIDVTHYLSGLNWAIVDVKSGDKVIRMMFPENRFLIKVDRW